MNWVTFQFISTTRLLNRYTQNIPNIDIHFCSFFYILYVSNAQYYACTLHQKSGEIEWIGYRVELVYRLEVDKEETRIRKNSCTKFCALMMMTGTKNLSSLVIESCAWFSNSQKQSNDLHDMSKFNQIIIHMLPLFLVLLFLLNHHNKKTVGNSLKFCTFYTLVCFNIPLWKPIAVIKVKVHTFESKYGTRVWGKVLNIETAENSMQWSFFWNNMNDAWLHYSRTRDHRERRT